MGVSLYTSRIVLNTLGVSDFGVYNIVGGVVIMLSFLNGTLSGSTSRFITFELGHNNIDRLKKTFNTSLTLHIGISVLILLIAESLGLWFVKTQLVIPENRIPASLITYQFVIISFIVSFMQIPYSASIIAHERMGIFAYISILESLLKLTVAYLISIGNFDKLVLYALLSAGVTTLILVLNVLYCLTTLNECRYSFSYDNKMLKSMLSFSGLDLYGSVCYMAGTQGINILLNLFFGPLMNAASGIAIQVRNAVSGFSNNFITAIRPQIVKSYAIDDIPNMKNLVYSSSKYSFLLLYLISLPLIVENNFILNLWLGKVPDYAILFCQLSLVYNLFAALSYPIIIAIQATGRMKRISFISGNINLIALPLTYFFLKVYNNPIYPFIISILVIILVSISDLIILRRYIPEFKIPEFLEKVISPSFLVCILSAIIPILITLNFPHGWMRFLISCFVSTIMVLLFTYSLSLNNNQRDIVSKKILCVLSKYIR